MSKKQLTIKEALAQGYKYCGETGRETLLSIENLDSENLKEIIKDSGDVFLAEKQCMLTGFPNADDISVYIDENTERHESGLESTSEIISSYIEEIQKILDRMKTEIKEKNATNTYDLTDIKLIPSKMKNLQEILEIRQDDYKRIYPQSIGPDCIGIKCFNDVEAFKKIHGKLS